MYARNGEVFDIDQPHIIGGNQFPPGIFAFAEWRAMFDIFPVIETPKPTILLTQRVEVGRIEQDPETQAWRTVWRVVDLTEQEIAAAAALLVSRATAAVNACFQDVDAVYADAIGQRGPEYTDAEHDARSFKAAGYTGTPTPYVSDYALHNPTGQVKSNTWAADAIIARADAFRAAALAMRSKRFECQAAMRAATTETELNAAVASWREFIAGLRAQLGL